MFYINKNKYYECSKLVDYLLNNTKTPSLYLMTQVMDNLKMIDYNKCCKYSNSLYLIAALALIHLLRKCQGRPIQSYCNMLWLTNLVFAQEQTCEITFTPLIPMA